MPNLFFVKASLEKGSVCTMLHGRWHLLLLLYSAVLATAMAAHQNDCYYVHRFMSFKGAWMNATRLGQNCCWWPENSVICETNSSIVLAINLSGKNLSGRVSGHMVQHLTNLSSLDLSNNSFTGNIPTQLWNLPRLRYLNLSSNKFDTDLSRAFLEVNNSTDLQVLDFSFNVLQGVFPTHVAKLLSALRSLNVSGNTKLSGSVDSETWIKFGPSAFENTGLLEGKDASPAPSPPLATQQIRVMGAGALVGAICGAILALSIISGGIILCCKRRRRKKWQIRKPAFPAPTIDKHLPSSSHSGMWMANVKDPNLVSVVIFEKPLLNLTFADLLHVTSSFDKVVEVGDDTNLVYKCLLPGVLPQDEEVVIKVIVEGRDLKDEEAIETFHAIGRIKHENILPLLGYCLVGEVQLLIYKFMQNGMLHDKLHALPEGDFSAEDMVMDVWEENQGMQEPQEEIISWKTRYKIALGVARALAFLHHGWSSQIVHKAISSSSILLDEDFEPRLALYGLANSGFIMSGWKLEGYVPPEYYHSWNPTTRGDVYSFGVVLLELVTGKKPFGGNFPNKRFNNVVSWVRHLMKEEKKAKEALDGRLLNCAEGSDICDGMLELLRIGYLCTADAPAKRPTMQQVVGLLKDISSKSLSSAAHTTSGLYKSDCSTSTMQHVL